VPNATDDPFGNQGPKFFDGGVIQQEVTNENDQARGLRRFRNSRTFLYVQRKRLFYENVLAGAQGFEAHAGVQVRGRSDDDSIDRARQNCVKIRHGRGCWIRMPCGS
jgi:hypothetical protein